MTERRREISAVVIARIGGVLYLVIIVLGLFGEAFVRDKLIVSGNAAATAENIGSFEWLWRLGTAGNLVHLVCAVGLTLIFYILLRVVSRDLALLVVFFDLISIGIEAASKLSLVAGLFPLSNAEYLKAFEPAQLHALAYLSIRQHGYGFGISLVFFGCACLIIGYLIFRSGFLPKAIGVLMQLAGLAYLTNSFALLLAPAFANRIFPTILVPAFIGEASLCLWLIAKGVNEEKWKHWASAQFCRSSAISI